MHTAKFDARQTDRRGPHPQPRLTGRRDGMNLSCALAKAHGKGWFAVCFCTWHTANLLPYRPPFDCTVGSSLFQPYHFCRVDKKKHTANTSFSQKISKTRPRSTYFELREREGILHMKWHILNLKIFLAKIQEEAMEYLQFKFSLIPAESAGTCLFRDHSAKTPQIWMHIESYTHSVLVF